MMPRRFGDSVDAVIRKAVSQSRIDPKSIAAIGITNQRETTVIWDRKTAKPFYHAIVWQCRRTAEACARLKKHEGLFRKTTGLVVDAYFSGTKIQWLLDHVPGLRRKAAEGQAAFGTIDTWLIYKLTDGASHVTDMTNASRTLIFDIKAKAWSKPLLKLLNIPENILPKVLPSSSVFGYTAEGAAGLARGHSHHGRDGRPAGRFIRAGMFYSPAQSRTPMARDVSCCLIPAVNAFILKKAF